MLVLSACGNEADTLSDKVNRGELSLEQKEIIEEYQKFNDEGKSDMVLYRHYKDFMEEHSMVKINDEIKEEYSRAVEIVFDKDIENFYRSYHNQVDYFTLDEETYARIMGKKEEKVKEFKSDISNVITSKRFEDFKDIKIDSLFISENLELNIIYEFAEIQYMESLGSDVGYTILKLSDIVAPNYTGMFNKEIKEMILLNVPREVWQYSHKVNANTYIPITIGLTDQEVLHKTSWGKPNRVNKTETAYGTREQWVYSNFKYLYFEDGYLVAIQTSN